VIELLDFTLRGGHEAPAAAARVARVTERYLSPSGARDTMAVVNEVVAWLTDSDPPPRTLKLELSVTSTVVCVRVTAAGSRMPRAEPLDAHELLRRNLPVTTAVAARYGIETGRRTRVWAEFDRREAETPVYWASQCS
jgi:hypothetical protein